MTISPDDVCKILESCAKLKLSELSFDNLHLKFLSNVSEENKPVPAIAPHTYPEQVHSEVGSVKSSSPVSNEDEYRSKEDRLQEMMILDPAQYEELLLSGDLKDDVERQRER